MFNTMAARARRVKNPATAPQLPWPAVRGCPMAAASCTSRLSKAACFRELRAHQRGAVQLRGTGAAPGRLSLPRPGHVVAVRLPVRVLEREDDAVAVPRRCSPGQLEAGREKDAHRRQAIPPPGWRLMGVRPAAAMLSRVNLAAGSPGHWLVTLADGLVVDVWADLVEGLAGPDDQRDYRFCNLMDVPPDMQEEFEVVGRTPTNPRSVIVTVARFPRTSVLRIDRAE